MPSFPPGKKLVRPHGHSNHFRANYAVKYLHYMRFIPHSAILAFSFHMYMPVEISDISVSEVSTVQIKM